MQFDPGAVHMPLNRFITFVKPYINVGAGAIAAWLVAKANLLGIPGLGEHGNELQTGIAAVLAWGVTQLAAQLGDQKWLVGHHLVLAGETEAQVAALAASPTMPPAIPVDAEFEAFISTGEGLPDDDEEFAGSPDQPAELTGPFDAPDEYLAEDYGELSAPAADELTGNVDMPDEYGVETPDEYLPDDAEEFAAPPDVPVALTVNDHLEYTR